MKRHGNTLRFTMQERALAPDLSPEMEIDTAPQVSLELLSLGEQVQIDERQAFRVDTGIDLPFDKILSLRALEIYTLGRQVERSWLPDLPELPPR